MNVTIHADNLAEGPEEIRVTLTTTDPEVTLNISQGIIEIIDDEGMLVSESICSLLPWISYYHAYLSSY